MITKTREKQVLLLDLYESRCTGVFSTDNISLYNRLLKYSVTASIDSIQNIHYRTSTDDFCINLGVDGKFYTKEVEIIETINMFR